MTRKAEGMEEERMLGPTIYMPSALAKLLIPALSRRERAGGPCGDPAKAHGVTGLSVSPAA